MFFVFTKVKAQFPKGKIGKLDTVSSKPIYPKKVFISQHWSSMPPYDTSRKHITQKDSNEFTKPRIIYHDLGISKEDSTRLAIEIVKQDIADYLYLKFKVIFNPIYIDTLFNNGFKIDTMEYFKLNTELAKEIREKKKR